MPYQMQYDNLGQPLGGQDPNPFAGWQMPNTQTYDPTNVQWSPNNTSFSFTDSTGATKWAVPVGAGMTDQSAWAAAGGNSPFLNPYGDSDTLGGWGPSNYQQGQRTKDPVFGQFSGTVPGLENLNLKGNSLYGYEILDKDPGETYTTFESLKPKGDFIADTLLPGIVMSGFGAGLGGAFGNFGPFSDSGFFGNMASGVDPSGLLSAGSDSVAIGGGGSDAIGDIMGSFDSSGMPNYSSPWVDTPTGSFDMWGSQSYPGGAPGTTIYSGMPNQNFLQSLAGQLGLSNSQATMLGKIAPSILGLLGSNAQTNALSDVAKQNAALQQSAIGMGAPYRAEALKMLQDPNSFFSGPVAQDNLKGVLQGLSVNGNPFGNPTSLALAQQGQRGLYNQTLANLGQMGGLSGYNAAGANNNAQTQLALQQAMSQGNIWNAVGSGLNSVLNPQPSILDILKELKGIGGTSLA